MRMYRAKGLEYILPEAKMKAQKGPCKDYSPPKRMLSMLV